MPRAGGRKLLGYIQHDLIKNNIKMGRDALFNLLRSTGILVRKTKRFHITTDSNHSFKTPPNLLKEMILDHAEKAFVSDITYIKTDQGHAYLALVTDPYSKKIMGWALDDNMRVSLVKEALEMAHKNTIHHHNDIVHHSDRGKQYCCPDFAEFAAKRGFILSTTQESDPYENAVAERINGILKYEFGMRKTFKNLEIAQKTIRQAVYIYNNIRTHWSLNLKTPQQVHKEYNPQQYKSYARQSA